MMIFFPSVLEQLHGKSMVMGLLSHPDHNVRYEALLAVQKLMVHNWWVFDKVGNTANSNIFIQYLRFGYFFIFREYLGRKLEQEQSERGQVMPIKAM